MKPQLHYHSTIHLCTLGVFFFLIKHDKLKGGGAEFLGGPGVRTQRFHCHGLGSSPDGELRSHKLCSVAKI